MDRAGRPGQRIRRHSAGELPAHDRPAFVKSAIQIKSLQSKLGADIVEDQTAFFKWQALCEFEKTFNNAIKEFGPLYANSLWIEDQPKYLAARKAEFQRYIERIEAIQANSKSSSASGGD